MSIATVLFFMWGFLTCLNDILIPHLKSIFSLNYVIGPSSVTRVHATVHHSATLHVAHFFREYVGNTAHLEIGRSSDVFDHHVGSLATIQ